MADQERRELMEALGRGAIAATVGAVPITGPIAAELLSTIIPNRRLDRLEQLLQRIAERVETLDRDRLRERFQSPLFVDLFEDGIAQAARAVTQERIDQIAELLGSSLTGRELDASKIKRLLRILADLSDVEIIILRYYGAETQDEREAIREQQPAVFRHAILHPATPPAAKDDIAVFQSYHRNLVDLGLLRTLPELEGNRGPRKSPKRRGKRRRNQGAKRSARRQVEALDDIPSTGWDYGSIVAPKHRISPLGRALLRGVGLLSDA